jgi:putative spermidine/putrescine transport system permease protein
VVTQIDPALEQASANLRANRFTTFRRVIIPLAMPGILAGLTLVFILSASAFITPRMVGGARVQMLGSLIYEQVTSLLNWPLGSAMSFVLLVLTLLLTMGVNMALAVRLTSTRAEQHAR